MMARPTPDMALDGARSGDEEETASVGELSGSFQFHIGSKS